MVSIIQRTLCTSLKVTLCATKPALRSFTQPAQFRRSEFGVVSNFKSLSTEASADEAADNDEAEEATTEKKQRRKIDPLKDRSKEIPLETSLRYLESSAYKEAYGDEPVWVPYRRNFKGQFAPKKTRRSCIRNQKIATGSPCPICRDEYLVIDHRNPKLLQQFVSPYTNGVYPAKKTGVCKKQHRRLLIAIERAHDQGYMKMAIKFRHYDYNEYYDFSETDSK